MTRLGLKLRALAAGLMLFAWAPLTYAEADTLRVAGLSQPVEIITDRWGIPHIYARNEADLFFAQGYNAARDRLFQFEMWRRQATGTTAEILGRKELKRDIGARLHKFRGDMEREMSHYHPRGELIITSFVRGVNAYIEETERNPSLLPLEFRLLGIRPGKWTPEVVISRHQGLLGNIGEELATGRAVARFGPKKVKELSFFQPANPKLEFDPAINPSLLTADILELYTAFRAPLRFEPSQIVAAYRGDGATFRQLAVAIPSELELSRGGEAIGSNNWVVSGTRMANGFPIMANDPHRAQQAPSLRYYAHLVAPGWNVIGGGEPVLPGISIGHNEYGAWGLTIFDVDGEDLYVYDTNPANPSQYRYRGKWEAMEVIRETIPVKGEPAVTAELKYTRHGPVLYEDRKYNKAYALRAAWMEIGGAPYLASLRMDQAKSWEEFRDASRYSHIPGENMVWADAMGNIGWQAVGISPIRPNWSGLVPVPGDGRYEWAGYLPIRQLPHIFNPEKGFWATANNYLVPPDYPHRNAVGYSWADPFRFNRVEEFLASSRRHTVADMMKLQHDELSIPARTLVPLLAGMRPDDPRVRQAIEQLLQWDYVLDKSSVPAGIYVAWERRLQQDVYNLFVPPNARDVIPRTALTKVIEWLLAPDGHFGKDPIGGRDALLLQSMEEAVAELTHRLGTDMRQWQYGQEKYKHALLRHPMSAAVTPEIRTRLEVGPVPRGGYGHTVNSTGGSNNQTSGASFRIIAVTRNWDESVGTNNPGQSGDPDSPHYRDLFPLWAAGEYFPVFYTREKVESVANSRSVLVPTR